MTAASIRGHSIALPYIRQYTAIKRKRFITHSVTEFQSCGHETMGIAGAG